MGKRSEFIRKPRDYYRTFDTRAGKALKPFIEEGSTYIEPYAGAGDLVDQLDYLKCLDMTDIEPQRKDITQKDCFSYTEHDLIGVDFVLSNPPWQRDILHKSIEHFASLRPTWFLHDANWLFNKSSKYYIDKYLVKVVTIGRMKWEEGTKMSSKDDCCWFLYDIHKNEDTKFYPRS